eukprot:m.256922 g.256922  ORF g.256922 m.256922 type:complete len:345 (-) comp20505_c0_seq1:280-1314(-)
MHPAWLAVVVIVCCCINVVSLELLLRDHVSTLMLSALQFATIAALEYLTSFRHVLSYVVPISDHATLVTLFAISTVGVNYAFELHVPMPLHIIIRSGALIFNMALSAYILKKEYSTRKKALALVITAGVVLASAASHVQAECAGPSCAAPVLSPAVSSPGSPRPWYQDSLDAGPLFGVLLLLVAQIAGSLLGIHQQTIISRHRSASAELMFPLHAVPAVVLLPYAAPHLQSTVGQITCGAVCSWLPIPISWSALLLLVNVLSQYLCAQAVHQLQKSLSFVNTSVVLTVRRLVSLLISVIFFKSAFTVLHGVATVLVLGGSLIFILPETRNPTTDADGADKTKKD